MIELRVILGSHMSGDTVQHESRGGTFQSCFSIPRFLRNWGISNNWKPQGLGNLHSPGLTIHSDLLVSSSHVVPKGRTAKPTAPLTLSASSPCVSWWKHSLGPACLGSYPTSPLRVVKTWACYKTSSCQRLSIQIGKIMIHISFLIASCKYIVCTSHIRAICF